MRDCCSNRRGAIAAPAAQVAGCGPEAEAAPANGGSFATAAALVASLEGRTTSSSRTRGARENSFP